MTERGVDDQLVLPSSPRGPCAEGVCLWALDEKNPYQLTWVLMKLYASYLIQAFRTPTPMRNPQSPPRNLPERERAGSGMIGISVTKVPLGFYIAVLRCTPLAPHRILVREEVPGPG